MMTKIEWDRRDDLRLSLAQALEQSPLKEALEVCASFETDAPQIFAGGHDLLHQAALSGSTREGYFRALRNLKSLARETVKRQEISAPWAGKRPE
jgi:hypothetical protein